jgi:hypothetical protein
MHSIMLTNGHFCKRDKATCAYSPYEAVILSPPAFVNLALDIVSCIFGTKAPGRTSESLLGATMQ